MSTSDHERERWLHAELRNVPLPEGLIERLKAIAAGTDDELDAALAEVTIPSGFMDRLKSVAREPQLQPLQPFEKASRADLAAKAATHGMGDFSADDLLEPVYVDPELDGRLRDVPIPPHLLSSLREVAGPRPLLTRLRTPMVEWVLAASLLVGLGLIYLGRMSSVVLTADKLPADGPGIAGQLVPPAPAPSPTDPNAGLAQNDTRNGSATDSAEYEPESIVGTQGPADDELIDELYLDSLVADGSSAADTNADESEKFELSRIDPLREVFVHQAPVGEAEERDLLVKGPEDPLPDLGNVVVSGPRGVAAPRVKQFDLLALIKEGVYPFVTPADHPELRDSRVPLAASSTAWRRTLQLVSEGNLPAPDTVRVEDFLAAVNYDFPLPHEHALGLRTAAGPSTFGDTDLNLLQVGVQAGRASAEPRSATHLTLLVDVSASMGGSGPTRADVARVSNSHLSLSNRLAEIRRAIARLAAEMSAGDRLSIVVFSERAEALLARAGRGDTESLQRALAAITPRSSANLDAGLQLAARTAAHPADRAEGVSAVTRRLVLLTDEAGSLSDEAMKPLLQLAAQIAEQEMSLEIIDVRPDEPRDERLHDLARAGQGELHSAAGGEAMYYALLGSLTGQPQVVARRARLVVSFNPEVVDRYRLLGHEPDGVGGLVAGKLESDLLAGQAATALYELKLNPSGGDDVGTAELTWRDPMTGIENRLTQRISRLQFATSLAETPISLQRAMLAAETAEILRGSKFAPTHVSGLRRILELTQSLSPRVYEDPSVLELLALVEGAQRIQAGKPAAASGTRAWWWRKGS